MRLERFDCQSTKLGVQFAGLVRKRVNSAGSEEILTRVQRHEATRGVRSAETVSHGSVRRDFVGIAEFAGLENDGVEQEETYRLHTAYDVVNAN